MNNPHLNLLKEIKWVKKSFEFLDLTLEMPKAHPDKLDVRKVKKLIGSMPVVGHTAWYLPIGSPFEELRTYALQELEKCAAVFEKLGVKKMNVHPDTSLPIKEKHIIESNIWSLKRLVATGRDYGLEIMLENTPGLFSRPEVLGEVFAKVPKLRLHLDIGHANIAKRNTTPSILSKFHKRLVHVHISDNRGKSDQHLAIGKGKVDWARMLGALKGTGYDDTITLEVFTSPEERLLSIRKLRSIWDKL